MVHIASWSGGKDSTAMIDILLRDQKPLDYIVFADTLMEFPEMYTYIYKVKTYWEQRYSAKIEILKPNLNYLDGYVFTALKYCRDEKNLDKVGMFKGFLNPTESFCTWRRESKVYPIERWIKKNFKGQKVIQYIGFTKNESHRLKLDSDQRYPLFEMGMSDNDCKVYLAEHEMENPLYRHFSRTGCRLCPYQSKRDWRQIWQHYPDVWAEIKNIEKSIKAKQNEGHRFIQTAPFVDFKTTEDLEKEFVGRPVFEFDDEPLKDCLCKI